jgi:hypothetical protein
LVAWQGANALECLQLFMTDRNATVREFARYYVGKWSSTAMILDHYRTLLAFGAGVRLAGCLAGMGDVGDATDVNRILPFCTHQRPTIRRVAFLALDRLVPLDDISLFLSALKDSSPRVRQSVAAALGRRSQALSADDLLQRFFHGEPQGRQSVVAILASLGFLDRLGSYLVISASHSSPFQEIAARNVRQLLRSTINGYIRIDPNAPALRRIASALPTASETLAVQVKDYIRLLTGMISWPEQKTD